MKQQQGAALVIVMAFLSGALLIGISGMNSALIDERLAGNYRATALAQMAAESGVTIRYEKNSTGESNFSCEELKILIKNNNAPIKLFPDFNKIESPEKKDNVTVGYYYSECQEGGKSAELIVGQVKNNGESSVNDFVAIYFYVLYPNGEGQDLDGGGSFGNSAVVAGSGGVRLVGGAQVSGGITTSGDVEIRGGALTPDSIDAAGTIIFPHYWDENETVNFREKVVFDSVAQDPLNIKNIFMSLDIKTRELTEAPYQYGNVRVGKWPLVDATISDNGLIGFNESDNFRENQVMARAVDYDVSEVPKIAGVFPVVRTRGFNQTNGSLTVTSDAVLIVDGDLILGGGGDEGLVFEGDSTLTVLVTGNVQLKSSLQMQDLSVEVQSGRPRFSIYSLGDQVRVDGSAQVMAMIYAPFASIDGSSTLGVEFSL